MGLLTKARSFARYLRQHAAKHGLCNTAVWLSDRIYTRWHEWRLGIDTRGFIPSAELETGPDGIATEPSSYGTLRRALKDIGPKHRLGAFLDYGCGKGRVVVWASQQAFARVIGVEKSPLLCRLAHDNIRRRRGKFRRERLEIVEADAADYPVPDDVTVVFLFNPFTGSVLRSAFQRIEASLLQSPRPLMVIYVRPDDQSDPFADSTSFSLRHRRKLSGFRGMQFLVYEFIPEEAATNQETHHRLDTACSVVEAI